MPQEKILIVGPAWVGDMVMAQSLFKIVKQVYPESILDVLAPDWTRALLSRMPQVDKAISMPLGHGEFNWRQRYVIGRNLKRAAYTRAYVLPNSFKSALIPFFAGIAKRVGWRGEMRYLLLNDLRVCNEQQYPLMIERFMALGLPSGTTLPKPYPLPELVIDKDSLSQTLQRYHLSSAISIVALCPGAAFGPSKRWPAEYFAEVAATLLATGKQVWLFGSKEDQPLTALIQQQTNNACIDLAGKTTLAEAIDLLSLAQVVVTNDSGLMHIGAALQRPLVAIYGSTSTKFTPPLGTQVKILNLNLECSPCFKRQCPLGHWRCMLDLKPQLVVNAVNQLLLERVA